MKTKIFWNAAEQDAVRAELVRVLRENPLLRAENALAAAQCVLPMERRRKMHQSYLYRVRDWIEAARREAKRPQEPTPAPAAPPVQPEPQPDLLRAILDQFLDALADKVAARVALRVADAAPGVQLRLKHDPAPPPNDRVARTGVLVVGLLEQQAHTIIHLFPQLELTCLTTEEALKREPLRRSHTVLMTKFINHSVQDRYRKAQNLHFCNGGVSELSAILKNIS